jgi:hypothetical protein
VFQKPVYVHVGVNNDTTVCTVKSPIAPGPATIHDRSDASSVDTTEEHVDGLIKRLGLGVGNRLLVTHSHCKDDGDASHGMDNAAAVRAEALCSLMQLVYRATQQIRQNYLWGHSSQGINLMQTIYIFDQSR